MVFFITPVYGQSTPQSTDGKTAIFGSNLSASVTESMTDCHCGPGGDLNADGKVNPVDVVIMVGYAYLGVDLLQRVPLCGFNPVDINCDLAANPVDIALLVAYVYLDRASAVCDPCTATVEIIDATHKHWDVSHAVHSYGMKPDSFWFGLGPFAIRPINMPQMLSPGDPGYPDFGSMEQVLGTSINGDARAYPISVTQKHEVVNDLVGGEYVSIAY